MCYRGSFQAGPMAGTTTSQEAIFGRMERERREVENAKQEQRLKILNLQVIHLQSEMQTVRSQLPVAGQDKTLMGESKLLRAVCSA